MKLIDGGVKVCFFIETNNGRPFTPTDKQIDAMLDIKDLQEVSSSHAQTYKVIFYIGLDDFTPEWLQNAKDEVLNTINPKRQLTTRKEQANDQERLL